MTTRSIHLTITDPLAEGAEPAQDVPLRVDPAEPIGEAPPELPAEPPTPPPPRRLVIHLPDDLVVSVRTKLGDDWSASRGTLAGEELKPIANRHPGRTKLKIRNLNTAPGAPVYITSRLTGGAGGANTFPIAAATDLDITSTGTVYACTDAGANTNYALIAEWDSSVIDPT